MEVKIINRSPFELPKYQTNGSSGIDIRANIDEDVVIHPFERMLIPTGLFMDIPNGIEAQIRARSGLAFNHGITMVNGVGTIDSDYRGEWKVAIINLSNKEYTIKPGDRIAQAIFVKYEKIEFKQVESFETTTSRHTGGFGSTGKS